MKKNLGQCNIYFFLLIGDGGLTLPHIYSMHLNRALNSTCPFPGYSIFPIRRNYYIAYRIIKICFCPLDCRIKIPYYFLFHKCTEHSLNLHNTLGEIKIKYSNMVKHLVQN